jgi:hypothetical protein
MASSYPIPEGSVVLLWAGENPDLHANLLEKLEAPGIPFSDKTMGDDEVAPTAEPLPIDWRPRFGFEVGVMSTDLPAAREILDALLNQEPADLEIPAQDENAAPEPPPPQPAADQELTVEIWSGLDDRIAQFLVAALQENQIPMHLETPGELTKIFAAPVNAARAREIAREVTQASPPE